MIPTITNPSSLSAQWIQEARDAGLPLPERAALATVSPNGQPSVRMVLVKETAQDGFVFYTNTKSRKASDLDHNPRAALCFHWPELGKQMRAEGSVEQVSDAEADAYFASRPRESQLGAWASVQSAVLETRDMLLRRINETAREYDGHDVPRPPHWSGYRLLAEHIEFWQEMPHRLHDRLLYTKRASGFWEAKRLYP